jgi:hypothetical protein
MPKLGQVLETPGGIGQVVSMQLLKELVTVRLQEENVEATFRCDELGLGAIRLRESAIQEESAPVLVASEDNVASIVTLPAEDEADPAAGRRRRRRRSGRRSASGF